MLGYRPGWFLVEFEGDGNLQRGWISSTVVDEVTDTRPLRNIATEYYQRQNSQGASFFDLNRMWIDHPNVIVLLILIVVGSAAYFVVKWTKQTNSFEDTESSTNYPKIAALESKTSIIQAEAELEEDDSQSNALHSDKTGEVLEQSSVEKETTVAQAKGQDVEEGDDMIFFESEDLQVVIHSAQLVRSTDTEHIPEFVIENTSDGPISGRLDVKIEHDGVTVRSLVIDFDVEGDEKKLIVGDEIDIGFEEKAILARIVFGETSKKVGIEFTKVRESKFRSPAIKSDPSYSEVSSENTLHLATNDTESTQHPRGTSRIGGVVAFVGSLLGLGIGALEGVEMSYVGFGICILVLVIAAFHIFQSAITSSKTLGYVILGAMIFSLIFVGIPLLALIIITLGSILIIIDKELL